MSARGGRFDVYAAAAVAGCCRGGQQAGGGSFAFFFRLVARALRFRLMFRDPLPPRSVFVSFYAAEAATSHAKCTCTQCVIMILHQRNTNKAAFHFASHCFHNIQIIFKFSFALEHINFTLDIKNGYLVYATQYTHFH